MPDNNNFLALQYAVGLLDEQQKQAIEKTQAFEKALFRWQLHLNRLNAQAPLEKESAQIIWKNVNAQIQQDLKSGKTGIISTLLGYWRYLLSGATGLGLFLSIALVNQSANAQLGWDINTNLSKQQISITATTHQHTDKASTCTLWVKKDNNTLLIGSMPETGKKTFDINEQTLAMLKNGEMIISFENKQSPPLLKPANISYQGKWII